MSLSQRWQQARLRFYRGRIRHFIDDQKWSEALAAIIDFAQWAQDRIDDAQVWVNLTVAATEVVAHLDDPGEYRAFLEHFASPFLGDPKRPRPQILEAFADIAEDADPAVMIAVGRWLTDARPHWPLGPYLMGHYGEELALDGGPPGGDIARYFERAARRARRNDLSQWQGHAELRAGAFLINHGADPGRGRQILGGLDWTQLTPPDQLWMARALSSSPEWTDRLRAMDILLDLHRALQSVQPGYQSLRRRHLQQAALAIFKLAKLDLPELEERRQRELSDALFTGPAHRQWQEFLKARRQLSALANRPLSDRDEALALLDQLATTDGDRWAVAAQSLRILAAGRQGEYGPSQNVPRRQTHSERLPLVDATAALLAALQSDPLDTESVSDALERLLARHAGSSDDPASLRPIALLWTPIVERAPLLCEAGFADELRQLARAYAASAPPPSFGWWALAAQLYNAQLPEAAAPIAARARASGPSANRNLRQFVARQALRQALDNRDARQAKRWLKAYES